MLHFNALDPYPCYIAFGILGILLVCQLYYIFVVYRKVARFQQAQDTLPEAAQPALSLIVYGRNEQEHISSFLPTILTQDYPQFELIYIDDFAEDETAWELKLLRDQFPQLRVVSIEEHIRLKHGKKFALTLAIKAATHEHLVFTDANCQPQSQRWLQEIAASFGPGKDIVLGYTAYTRTAGLGNTLCRYDNSLRTANYLSYALKGKSYSGSSQNMAYSKSLFFKAKGFAKQLHLQAGDNDLFVAHHGNASNVAINIAEDAHMWVLPPKKWYKQTTNSPQLRSEHRAAILFYLSLPILVLAYPSLWYLCLGAYLLRLLAQYLCYPAMFKKLQNPDLIWPLPFVDLLYYFYICIRSLRPRNKKSRAHA